MVYRVVHKPVRNMNSPQHFVDEAVVEKIFFFAQTGTEADLSESEYSVLEGGKLRIVETPMIHSESHGRIGPPSVRLTWEHENLYVN